MATPEFFDGYDQFGTDQTKILQLYPAANLAGTTMVDGLLGAAAGKAVRQANTVAAQLPISFSARQTPLVGFRYRYTTALAGAPFRIFEFRGGAQTQCGLGIDNAGRLIIYRGIGFGQPINIVATSVSSLTLNQQVYIECRIFIDAVVGTAEVRVNGSNVGWINAANINTQNLVTNTADNGNFMSGGDGFSNYSGEFDDFYLNAAGDTVFRGERRVFTRLPTSDGAFQDWIPNGPGAAYTKVNEVPDDGGVTTVDNDVIGETSTFGYDPMPGTPPVIDAAMGLPCITKDDAGARSFEHVCQSGPTVDVGAPVALSQVYQYYPKVYGVDPNTGVAWTTAALDALEMGTRTA